MIQRLILVLLACACLAVGCDFRTPRERKEERKMKRREIVNSLGSALHSGKELIKQNGPWVADLRQKGMAAEATRLEQALAGVSAAVKRLEELKKAFDEEGVSEADVKDAIRELRAAEARVNEVLAEVMRQ